MKRVVINIRASKNISGLVKVSVTSPTGLMKFFLNVEPCSLKIVKSIMPFPMEIVVWIEDTFVNNFLLMYLFRRYSMDRCV